MAYEIYQDPPHSDLLGQGDILDADQLRDNLRGHQDYFATQKHFKLYMILTQTCDLARGGVDFVFLAAVRSLNNAFKYQQIESSTAVKRNHNFVRDLYNHSYNKRGYFYLPCDSTRGIKEESVTDLRVMFSLHKMHYSAMLQARLSAITDRYAAQLGHIAGHMFNRIAIPGWNDIFEDISVDEQVAKTLNEQGERYRGRLVELLAEAGRVCAIRDCGKEATQFRSLPGFSENDEITYRERVLCSLHTKRWDDDRTLP